MNNFLSKSSIILGLSIACTFSLVTPSFAQYKDQEDGAYQSNEEDPMSGTLGGIDPIDLIHNANLSTGRNAEEFNQDSQLQIENSAEEFRRLQQERMLQQNNSVPASTEDAQ